MLTGEYATDTYPDGSQALATYPNDGGAIYYCISDDPDYPLTLPTDQCTLTNPNTSNPLWVCVANPGY
jgi:hypothetical protein